MPSGRVARESLFYDFREKFITYEIETLFNQLATENLMDLSRQQAKILGVHRTLLSKCLKGHRNWNPELKDRYDPLISILPNNGANTGDKDPHARYTMRVTHRLI